MFKRLLPLLLLLYCVDVSAQQPGYDQQKNFLKANSYWTIRDVDIDFNRNPPLVASNKPIDIYEGGASVADPETGAPLFSSNGFQCWDRNRAVMPNGDSLLGNGAGMRAGSTTQGVCIVPMIDTPGKYYLFSLSGSTDGGPNNAILSGSLYYSVIDMSLRSGIGDVVAGRKNILLDKDTLSEGMIAIPGDNCDIWLVVHQATRAEFRVYHITASGIDPNPVLSTTGEMIWSYGLGGMSVSPSRERIVFAPFSPFCMSGVADSISGVLLFKFNPETGKVSDGIQVEKDLQTYSVVFSPDNSKIYMGNYDHMTDIISLQQYDISKYDTATINSSKKLIASLGSMFQGGTGYGTLIPYMRLYKDTIYFPNVEGKSQVAVVSSINKPNLSGTACDYQNVTIRLPSGSLPSICLPNEVVYPIPADSTYSLVMDTLVCGNASGEGIPLNPRAIIDNYEYTWNDGTSATKKTVASAGKYWVAYTNGCHYKVDSFIVRRSEMVFPVININVFELGTTAPYKSYQWILNGAIIPGATDSIFTVTENGMYRVIVSDGLCSDTSEVYKVTNYTSIDPIKEIAWQTRVYPNPTSHIVQISAPVAVDVAIYSLEGRLMKQVKAAKKINVQDMAEGVYFMHIMDGKGSRIKVEKLVKFSPL